jgi:hypothetical protein
MAISRRTVLSAASLGALVATGSAESASAEPYRRSTVATSRSWNSGVSDDDYASFGAWRGSPVQIVGMFGDASVTAQTEQWQFAHSTHNADVDLAVGGPLTHTWAETAAGAEVALWKTIAGVLDDNWHYRTVHIRYAHEANGTWARWSAKKAEIPAFKASFRLFAKTMRAELPAREVKFVFAPNFSSWNWSPDLMFPGTDVVDVVGVSMYEWNLTDTAAKWKTFAATNMSPAYWSAFAKRHGKPLAFSEWGGRSGYFITQMNSWMRAHAGTGAGRVLYDVYLNTNEFVLTGATATSYRKLRWGR